MFFFKFIKKFFIYFVDDKSFEGWPRRLLTLSPNPPCQQECGHFGPKHTQNKGVWPKWRLRPPPDSESSLNDSSHQLKRRLCTATTCDKQGDCWKHEAAALLAAVLVKPHLEPRGSRWHMGPQDRRLRAPPGSCYGSGGGGN